MSTTTKTKREFYNNLILRCAALFTSRPVSKENIQFHNKVVQIQCKYIRLKKSIK